MTDQATPGHVPLSDLLGLLDEWAEAACVRFVSRSHGQCTTDTVSRDDLLQLMRAVQAAERERLATLADTRPDGWFSLTAVEIRRGKVL